MVVVSGWPTCPDCPPPPVITIAFGLGCTISGAVMLGGVSSCAVMVTLPRAFSARTLPAATAGTFALSVSELMKRMGVFGMTTLLTSYASATKTTESPKNTLVGAAVKRTPAAFAPTPTYLMTGELTGGGTPGVVATTGVGPAWNSTLFEGSSMS